MSRGSMTALVEEYLEHRRSLGFKLKIEGQQLLNFAAYADRIGHRGSLTLDLAVRWARLPDGASDLYLARRLEVVRCFARHRAVHDPETEVPAERLLGRAHRRTTPYVFAESELARLVAGTSSLQPADSIRPATYATLLGLLSCTGLRISEALRLKRNEVDLQSGVLRILMTKFRKSRLVPLHSSAVHALAKYADVRDSMFPKRSAEVFFVGRDGAALPYTTVRSTFRWLCRRLGIDTPAGRRRPRIHDMRHSFACRRLQLWYKQGCRRRLFDRFAIDLSGARKGHRHVLVPHRHPGVDVGRCTPLRALRCATEEGTTVKRSKPLSPSLGPLIQDFFCQRLIEQRNASPRTVAAYRDTFRLLIRFLAEKLSKRIGELVIGDLDAPCVLLFLNHLESERKNTIRTRNARLAAIRSFLKYASWREPLALPTAQRTLAIPMKRFDRPLMGFLSRDEVLAIQDAPSACSVAGQRDRVLLALMYNTGARVSEVAALRVGDVTLDQTAAVALRGKGRKERTVPLWKSTAALLKKWLRRLDKDPGAALLPSSMGRHMSRSGIESRLKLAVRAAASKEPRLTAAGRRISPHTLRHTTAMHLLQSGIDTSVIALWLGHESPTTTHGYVEADLAMKERALEKLKPPRHRKLRYQPNEKILQFLESL